MCCGARADGLLNIAMKARKAPNDFFMGYDSPKENTDAVLAYFAKDTTD